VNKSDYILTSDPEVAVTVEAAGRSLIIVAATIIGGLLHHDVNTARDRFAENGTVEAVDEYEEGTENSYRSGLMSAARAQLRTALRIPSGVHNEVSQVVWRNTDCAAPTTREEAVAAYRGYLDGEVLARFTDLYKAYAPGVPAEYATAVLG